MGSESSDTHREKIPRALESLEKKRKQLLYELYGISRAINKLNRNYLLHAKGVVEQTRFLFNDREVVILLLWAIISPALALAYIIWIKYPKLRIIAIPLIILSLVQFAGQWGGILWLLQRFGII